MISTSDLWLSRSWVLLNCGGPNYLWSWFHGPKWMAAESLATRYLLWARGPVSVQGRTPGCSGGKAREILSHKVPPVFNPRPAGQLRPADDLNPARDIAQGRIIVPAEDSAEFRRSNSIFGRLLNTLSDNWSAALLMVLWYIFWYEL